LSQPDIIDLNGREGQKGTSTPPGAQRDARAVGSNPAGTLTGEISVRQQSLQDLLQTVRNPVDMLRNSKVGAYIYPVVPPEFTNWRDEQRAWRETCVLFDQSHHMVEQYLEGPDAFKLLSHLAFNSFASFPTSRAKQFVPCTYDGYVIGDGILFRDEENKFTFVGRAPTANWIQFHAETGGYDVKTSKDDRSPSRPGGKPVIRRHYRYQIQGPNAQQVIEKLNGGPIGEIKFFHVGSINIAGRKVKALRHGMAGAPGLEVWGPYAEGDEIKAAIIEAGKEFGLLQVGARAYSTNALESGWIPSPLPAIYTGEKMKPYRQWLPAASYEGLGGSLGGSFYSNNIEDYYVTPYELGYGGFAKFDHDFIGHDALKKMADEPHRRKVTYAWNAEDLGRAMVSMLSRDNCKYIDMPNPNYTSATYDRMMANGHMVGLSMFSGYSFNERTMLSLGIVDPDIEIGHEVTLIWGEEGGGSGKTTVERHKQTEIRAIVSPAPYSEVVRRAYAPGWRTAQTV
jgi:vanillate/3-O-methylgallate O-demethylase